ncbi:DNA-binding response regulator, LytR/AlgR family [Flavobacterium sp. CF108]|uniref:LytR/AlgR family response regulator transcription factor n=1 Tax=unclassified Flavobacterium TaxID=196869 RepID=UPI0008CCACE6|nr:MULTISPECIES: response regulator transcription factor [unclassified Flavobacterium]SEP16033.1 two component transcriptional regulator, LytTR family [Flavobacterium sp. fv08]SHH47269.1 DNA-binding response regulator, LytR/AlgR family [Flavobacterium sp. CF108]
MNTKLKCLLLDDEIPGLTYLKMLCEQIPELEIVKTFNNPQKLLSDIPELEFDLLISDIEMPGMDGLHLAELVGDKLVIFCTAYKEYAADAFNIDAVDYITKPVKLERLQKAVSKALERFEKPDTAKKFIQLNTDKGKTLLYFNQIQYIKTAVSDSRDKTVLLADGSFLNLKNVKFDTLLKELPETNFCRINKKEIIAVKAIKFFNHNEIVLHHIEENNKNTTLLLSETYRSDFLKKVKL